MTTVDEITRENDEAALACCAVCWALLQSLRMQRPALVGDPDFRALRQEGERRRADRAEGPRALEARVALLESRAYAVHDEPLVFTPEEQAVHDEQVARITAEMEAPGGVTRARRGHR